jgi:hypothetical protein
MSLPATVYLETAGGRTVVLAESDEVAKRLAKEGELVLTPKGVEVLADIYNILNHEGQYPKVVRMTNVR